MSERILIEEPVKPKKKDQIRLDEEAAKRAFKRVNTFEDIRSELVKGKEKRAGEELIQENEEEVAIDAIPLAVKSPRIVDWKIHKEGKKSCYQTVRADEKSHIHRRKTREHCFRSPELRNWKTKAKQSSSGGHGFDEYDLEKAGGVMMMMVLVNDDGLKKMVDLVDFVLRF
nr:hypothetical protein [Tanacetum cinerariifolium]